MATEGHIECPIHNLKYYKSIFMNRALIIRVSNVVHIHARYSDRGLGFICELTYHSAFPDFDGA